MLLFELKMGYDCFKKILGYAIVLHYGLLSTDSLSYKLEDLQLM